MPRSTLAEGGKGGMSFPQTLKRRWVASREPKPTDLVWAGCHSLADDRVWSGGQEPPDPDQLLPASVK